METTIYFVRLTGRAYHRDRACGYLRFTPGFLVARQRVTEPGLAVDLAPPDTSRVLVSCVRCGT